MNTKFLHSCIKPSLHIALLALALLGTGLCSAQLSSPLAGAKPAGKTASAGAASGGTASTPGVPAGQGAGVHSPDSPFAPLQERADVVPWAVLTSIKTKTEKNKITPVYTMDQMALNQKSQRIQGFMMPLEPGEKQRHFLLTSVPMSCGFCTPGGPESMVEVRTKTPIKYTLEPVVVEGKFAVLSDDPYGLYYRITEAASVK
jgi:uncharacterized protein